MTPKRKIFFSVLSFVVFTVCKGHFTFSQPIYLMNQMKKHSNEAILHVLTSIFRKACFQIILVFVFFLKIMQLLLRIVFFLFRPVLFDPLICVKLLKIKFSLRLLDKL